MNAKKYFWIFFLVLVFLAASFYFSWNKLREFSTTTTNTVVVDVPKPSPVPAFDGPANQVDAMATLSNNPNCEDMPEFKRFKSELGAIVNVRELREKKTQQFARFIENFRAMRGLPLALGVNSNKLDDLGVVYNRCKSLCHGTAKQVFVRQITPNRRAQLLLKNGQIKSMDFDSLKLEVATIDELNSEGVPFQSWVVPYFDDAPSVKGKDLFYKLDMDHLWLKISPKGNWTVVADPAQIVKLTQVEAPTTPGCNAEEHCLTTANGTVKGTLARHFKAPKACPSL